MSTSWFNLQSCLQDNSPLCFTFNLLNISDEKKDLVYRLQREAHSVNEVCNQTFGSKNNTEKASFGFILALDADVDHVYLILISLTGCRQAVEE